MIPRIDKLRPDQKTPASTGNFGWIGIVEKLSQHEVSGGTTTRPYDSLQIRVDPGPRVWFLLRFRLPQPNGSPTIGCKKRRNLGPSTKTGRSRKQAFNIAAPGATVTRGDADFEHAHRGMKTANKWPEIKQAPRQTQATRIKQAGGTDK